MKKRIIATVLAIMMLMSVTVIAGENSNEMVSALENGLTNVPFNNGYYGFCIDNELKGAYKDGVKFTEANSTSAATSNKDDSDISQQLKIIFTQCFEDIFISDGYSRYVINPNVKDAGLPIAIYYIVGEKNFTYIQPNTVQSKIVNTIKNYNGPEIPDDGYQLTLDNGDVITFHFMVLIPDDPETQTFFAYKLDVTPAGEGGGHEHDFTGDWQYDDENHWKECGDESCNETSQTGKHSGGTATCVDKAVCEVCAVEYGNVDKENHTGETEVRNASEATEFEPGYTGDTYCKACNTLIKKGEEIPANHTHTYSTGCSFNEEDHWFECECGDKKGVEAHSGGVATCVDNAVCEVCAVEYGNVDKENHTGETEVRNAKEATESEPGYTGDTYCKACNTLIKKGEEIPANHTHTYSTGCSFNEEDHWFECECGDKKDVEAHSGGVATCVDKAVCEICAVEYGNVDKENHTGETEIRNAKEATEFEPGYTGDTYCKDCSTLLEEGTIIPATHIHKYAQTWHTDSSTHWKECECGEISEEAEHTYSSGRCTVCEKEDPSIDYAPATGDNSMIFMWLTLAGISTAGIISISYKRRKNSEI